jgi:hypothetical protein
MKQAETGREGPGQTRRRAGSVGDGCAGRTVSPEKEAYGPTIVLD